MTQETKDKYRIRNWAEYNKALIQRGSITLWFSEDAIDQWHKTEKTGKKGLKKLLDLILQRKIKRLVITHKDRLLRFGIDASGKTAIPPAERFFLNQHLF